MDSEQIAAYAIVALVVTVVLAGLIIAGGIFQIVGIILLFWVIFGSISIASES